MKRENVLKEINSVKEIIASLKEEAITAEIKFPSERTATLHCSPIFGKNSKLVLYDIKEQEREILRLGMAIYHGVKDYLVDKFPNTDVSEDLIKKEGYTIRVERARSKKTEIDNILIGFESLHLDYY